MYQLWVLKKSQACISYNSLMVFCPFYIHISYVIGVHFNCSYNEIRNLNETQANFCKKILFYSQPLTTANSSTPLVLLHLRHLLSLHRALHIFESFTSLPTTHYNLKSERSWYKSVSLGIRYFWFQHQPNNCYDLW